MDVTEVYDYEMKKIGEVWASLVAEFSKRPNTRANLEELSKRAAEAFQRIGFVVEVNTIPCLIADANGNTGAPEIVLIGRVPGTHYQEDGVTMFDHELKRAEVLTARERGERFAGEKDKPLR
jgi:hypothetical protein